MRNWIFGAAALLLSAVCTPAGAQVYDPGTERGTEVYASRPPLDSALLGVRIYDLLEAGPGAEVNVRRSVAADTAMQVWIGRNAEKKLHGYRIRLFFDNRQNARGQSEEVERAFRKDFPLIPVYRSYTNPYFKVAAGDFRTKSDALRALQLIRTLYPKAFVIKDVINYSPLD